MKKNKITKKTVLKKIFIGILFIFLTIFIIFKKNRTIINLFKTPNKTNDIKLNNEITPINNQNLSIESIPLKNYNISTDNKNFLELIKGDHPRNEGFWIQYQGLKTALRKNIVISDIVYPDSKFENYKGQTIQLHDKDKENPENYDNTHNHYQNILSEVINFSPDTNAISIWGDSAATVNNSKAWGGFFSARSICHTLENNLELKKYIPKNTNLICGNDYDAQLTGVEIDVLNEGKPGVYPNKSKTGLQIVGFGNPNSMAIEIRSEDSDKSNYIKKGVFESGIYFKNSLAEYGRLIVSDQQTAKIGLDFKNTLFTEGAISLKTNQVGTGIVFNNGLSGEIYGGNRWNKKDDNKSDYLTLRLGKDGIRIVSNDNTKELLTIDNNGTINSKNPIKLSNDTNNFYLSKNIKITICVLIIINFFLFIFNIILLLQKYNFVKKHE